MEESTEDLASTAYRYRKWKIGPETEIIVRCEFDAVMNVKD